MTPHPSVETALRETRGDRAAARRLIRRTLLNSAERDAAVAGLSLRCSDAVLGGLTHTCANSGDTCICQCHDEAAP